MKHALLSTVLIAAAPAMAQDQGGQPGATGGGEAERSLAERLTSVPVTAIFPGAPPQRTQIENPFAGDADAAERGKMLFAQMNCSGCHAANGAGGMGPALSNSVWIYGGTPEQLYLTILHGRPAGMPTYAELLSEDAIWSLVTYIESISREPARETWGQTVSVESFTIEQVSATEIDTVDPWAHTQPFSYGQKPSKDLETEPPLADDPVPAPASE